MLMFKKPTSSVKTLAIQIDNTKGTANCGGKLITNLAYAGYKLLVEYDRNTRYYHINILECTLARFEGFMAFSSSNVDREAFISVIETP